MIKERLKELRKEKDLFQKDVAKLLNITKTGYASYEQGLCNPPVESIMILADFYNVSTDYILGFTDIKYNQDELDFYNQVKEKDIDIMSI